MTLSWNRYRVPRAQVLAFPYAHACCITPLFKKVLTTSNVSSVCLYTKLLIRHSRHFSLLCFFVLVFLGSRIDIHRALHDAKEGENVELRAQLAEAKEEKQILLAEMERLRARLGINSAPIVASTATLDLSPLPISGAE